MTAAKVRTASFELGQRSEDSKDQLAGRGCGVDRGALLSEDFQADASVSEVVHGVDQVPEVTRFSLSNAGGESPSNRPI